MIEVNELINYISIFIVVVSIVTLILLYFIIKLLHESKKLIEQERSAMLKDVKKILKK